MHPLSSDLELNFIQTSILDNTNSEHLPLNPQNNVSLSESTIVNYEKLYFPFIKKNKAGQSTGIDLRNRREINVDRIIKALAPFPQLLFSADLLERVHTIDVGGTKFSDWGAFYLSDYPSLTRLYLRNTKITDIGIANLPFLTLKILDLESTKITDAIMPFFSHFQEMLVLNLNKTEITDKSLHYLANIPKLTTLHLRHVKMTNKGIALFRIRKPNISLDYCVCYLQKLPTVLLSNIVDFLDKWDLIDFRVTSQTFKLVKPLEFHSLNLDSFDDLKHLIENCDSKVVSLSLRKWSGSSNLSRKNLERIALNLKILKLPFDGPLENCFFLRNFTKLTNLSLNCDFLDEELIQTLSHFEKLKKLKLVILRASLSVAQSFPYLPNLEELNLNFSWEFVTDPISRLHHKNIKSLASCTKLKKLKFSASLLTEKSISFLSNFLQLQKLEINITPTFSNEGIRHIQNLSNLTTLSFNGSNITDKGLSVITKKLLQLNVLDISNNKITDNGASYISCLNNLEKLVIANTNITDKGLNYLTEKMSQLKVLDISENQITNNGTLSLMRLQKLKALYLIQIKIENDVFNHLTKNLKQLECLEISQTSITNEGIYAVTNLTNLKILNIAELEISDEILVNIKKTLPNLSINSFD